MSGQSRKVGERILLGTWRRDDIDLMLRTATAIAETAEKIEYISRQFLGLPYVASTLRGSPETPELFVIDLRGVDCFTCLDYVEAMRLSRDFEDFRELLRRVRYRSAIVAYENRRHFFTDWRELPNVRDVTAEVGREKTKGTTKLLNRDDNGSSILEGIPIASRRVDFIPAGSVDREVVDRVRTGDYLGIYAGKNGLDVSHVGIAVRNGEALFLRHASSLERKVIDQDFGVYLEGKPGFIVLRPVTAP